MHLWWNESIIFSLNSETEKFTYAKSMKISHDLRNTNSVALIEYKLAWNP